MKIRITEYGKKPYIQEVNEKISKRYLAKKNPKFKYELVEEKPKEDPIAKFNGLKKKEGK